MKIIEAKDGRKYRRISRWISLKTNYNPTKRNSLWDYATDEAGNHPYDRDFDPTSDLYLDYFRFGGRTYALEQFYRLGTMWIVETPIMYDDEDGKLGVIGTVDMDSNMFHPIYGEWDECCEHVRLYEEV